MKKLLTAYIGVGLVAFAVSFIFELIMLFSFTANLFLSVALTMVLECSKLLLTIFHRFVEDKKYKISDSVRTMSFLFRFGLVFISVLCSLAYFAASLDRPNLEQVKTDDKSRVAKSFDEKLAMLNSQRQKRLDTIRNEIREKYTTRNQELDALYLPKISELEGLRKNEFDRVINGVRKGAYWSEYDRQLQELKSEYKSEKDLRRASEDTEMNQYIPGIEAEFQKKIDTAISNKESALTEISTNNYELDDRAKNQKIVSLLTTLDKGMGINISYLAFAILLSILTSLLLELAIYLAFSYIVMFNNTTENVEYTYAPGNPQADYKRVYDDPSQGIYTNPAADENMAGPEIDPETFDFLKNLSNQFGPGNSQSPNHTPENPCGQ